MRAPFNSEIDLYNGPTAPDPGGLRAFAVSARVVPDVAFVDVYAPLDGSLIYITMDEEMPRGPACSLNPDGTYLVDYGAADRVAIPSGGEPLYCVVRVETRTWPENLDYFRAHIALLPLRTPTIVGCDAYFFSPWGTLLERTGPMAWGFPTTPMTTDGLGNWEMIDLEDDVHWITSGWNGEGSTTFHDRDNPTEEVDVSCVE